MQFYIDIEERKRVLLEKIKSKNFSLSSDENLLIEFFPEIKRESFKILLEGREVWTKDAVDYFYRNIGSEDLSFLEDNHFYYFSLAIIDKGDLSDLEELIGYTEKKSEIYQYLIEKLKDPNYKVERQFGTFAATAMIEAGRYELLSLIPRGYYDTPKLSQEDLKKVLEHYPYSFSDLCLPIDKNLLEEARKNTGALNVYELFDQFSNNRENIFPLLKQKLLREQVDISYPLNKNIDVSDFYNLLTEEEKEIFKKKMIFLDLSWYFEHTSSREVAEDVSLIAKALKNSLVSYAKISYYSSILLSNREVLDSLLEKKQIDLVLSSPLADEYVPIIMDKINSKEIVTFPNIPEIILLDLCRKHPEFLRVLLRQEQLSESELPIFMKDDTLSKIINEEIFEKGTAVLLNKLSLKRIKEFISYGNIETIIRNISQAPDDIRNRTLLLTEEECNQLIESLKGKMDLQDRLFRLVSAIVFSNPTVLKFYLHSSPIMLEKVIDYINHHDNLSNLYTDNLYHEVKEYYAEKYDLSIENLDCLENAFGPTIVRYIENETILKLTRLDSIKLNKLIGLFPKVTYDMKNIETMYDSLKQYAFSKENVDIVNIFARIKHSIEDNTPEFLKDLEELVSVMDNRFYKYYEKKDPDLVNACMESPREFLKTLVTQINSTNPEIKENALRTLHKITDYYIAMKREDYRKEYHMIEELRLPYELDAKDLEKKLLLPIYEDKVEYYDPLTGEVIPIIDGVAKELGIDKSFACDVIEYYLYKKEPLNSDLDTVKKNIRFVIPTMQKIIKQYLLKEVLQSYAQRLDFSGLLKRNYYAPSPALDIYQLLSSLRLDVLEKNLLEDTPTNNKIYQSLQETMKKHKLHVMPACFSKLLESDSIQISSDMNNISSFISYYYQVYETERKRLESQGKDSSNLMLSATNILLNASVLSGVSSVYSQILGSEDSKLVKANPGPNAAIYKTAGDARLKEAVSWTIKNFKRMEVTVPTFSEDIPIKEDSSLRVVVGNFTHPSNITHGERTGACMRVGGVGETLFNFCLEDVNGFHIRFEDAQTGEYISRVSGFRNGNTVFLNELRNSCNRSLYSDEDIIKACKKAAEILIEKSKDSTCPIENVVVAKAYATEDLTAINLGITNNKKGLKRFYSDIQNSGVVLATTGNPLTPINMDKSKVPTYLPARDKVCALEDLSQLLEKMNRVHTIKKVLEGNNYEYIEPLSFEQDIVYGFANQDWYICMDSVGNIYEEIIPLDKRAQDELETARKIVEQYVPEKKEEDIYQM